ncbi:MAG TPA: mechanosensitive ion channel family protein [Nannocystis sp.]|jgi:small conductance mechanosensitive channel
MQLSELLERLFATLRRWFEAFGEILPNLVVAVLVLLIFGYGSRYVGRTVCRLMSRVTTHATLSDLLGTIARVTTIICGLLIALGLLQLDKTVTSLLAGVGVVGLALGFAFQDIAANFMSGFIMALRPPFEKGDLVDTGGQVGIIERIELRATLLTTLQGLSVIIPNKDVFQSPIINYTRTGDRRMDLLVGIEQSAPLELAQSLAVAAARELKHRNPAREPEVFFTEFIEDSVLFTVRVWLASSDERTFLEAKSAAIIGIKQAFDAHEIAIFLPGGELGAQDRKDRKSRGSKPARKR